MVCILNTLYEKNSYEDTKTWDIIKKGPTE